MRDIKFRAWNGSRMIREDDFFVRYGKAWEFMEFDPPQKKDYPLMQYTGLKDVNGVEIYEGDVVEIAGDKWFSPSGYFGVVKFNTNNFARLPAFHVCDKYGESIEHYYGIAAGDEWRVIGNIYENPELLEAK